MPATEATRQQRQCGRKIRYTTLEGAQTIADQMLQDRIYNQMEPRAYRCDYGNHYHVGHSLKRGNCCGRKIAVMDVTEIEDADRPASTRKRGRPALEPTERISLRLPVSTLDIIRRRAANMPPSVYIEQRVIHHEVVRRHYLTKAEKDRNGN